MDAMSRRDRSDAAHGGEGAPGLATQGIDWRKALAGVVQMILLLVVVAGVYARIVGLPLYVADSGDEWGNTIAPLRVLFDRGDPGVFLHPALYYYVTAAVYAALYAVVKATGVVHGPLSITDLFVLDDRYFVFAARGVSVLSAVLAMWALYALAKSLWGRTAGCMAAALLAVCAPHAVYSDAVRVDSLFLAVFIYACSCIVRMLTDGDRSSYHRAGFFIGLAAGANYNGGILFIWLIAAHLLRIGNGRRVSAQEDPSSAAPDTRTLCVALGLSLVGFVASNPFALLRLETFIRTFLFVSGLSVVEHPGAEGKGVLFYAAELAHTTPYLLGVIGVSALAIALFGNRAERFVLSLPVGYFALFSLVRTKYDRFILPAEALFLLVASGLPAVLARRLGQRRVPAMTATALSYALLFVCLATMAPQSIPIPRHDALPRSDALLFDWIEANAPPRSNILVESGILPLVDALITPDGFGAELRKSIAAVRPRLDHQFAGAVYIGGRTNYEPGSVAARHIDYAIISPRNERYIESRCDVFPDVCAFYAELRADGRIAYRTPDGFEMATVYDLRGEANPS